MAATTRTTRRNRSRMLLVLVAIAAIGTGPAFALIGDVALTDTQTPDVEVPGLPVPDPATIGKSNPLGSSSVPGVGDGGEPESSGGDSGAAVTGPGTTEPSGRSAVAPSSSSSQARAERPAERARGGGGVGAVADSARRATASAAGRAIRIARPLAPPLTLAVLMLVLLGLSARGSDRLVKVEHVTGRRTYRL